jgi:hypothetical protein
VLAAAAVCAVVTNLLFLPQMLLLGRPFRADAFDAKLRAALVLNEIATEDASVGVLSAGAVPYYTGLRAVDFLGKNDAYLAQLPPDLSGAVSWDGLYSVPGHNKYDLHYSIEQLRPTYIQASFWGSQDLTPWVEAHYERVTYKGARLWLLKDSPDVRWELLAP